MDERPTDQQEISTTATPEKLWRPLDRFQRRVLGVLVEKAKTTPDAYPMTIAAIITGSNQKSNRSPQMSINADQVETSLAQLRGMQAVTEIFSTGRVAKFRHHFYEWLGVRGAEAAVMIELMLRGEQTIGELRGRAARFDESIIDLNALKPILDSLIAKQLVIALTPEGRGQIVTHNLYQPQELDSVRRGVAANAASVGSAESMDASSPVVKDSLREQLQLLAARIERIERELGISNP